MANYTYYGKATVQNDKVAETDAGFAVPIIGTYDGTGDEPDLRTIGNGGHIQNTDASGGASGAHTVPADLAFRTTADMTIAGASLDFEIEKYDATTGEIVAWVQSGVIVDTDVDIYMIYGNAGVTTSQESIAGTWDANFKGVQHMGEPSGTLFDSTSNAINLADHASDTGKDGKIGDGQEFDDLDDYYSHAATALNGIDDYIVEAWLKHPVSAAYEAIATIQGATGYSLVWLGLHSTTGKLRWLCRDPVNVTVDCNILGDAALDDGNWHYVVGRNNAGTYETYVDAVKQIATATGGHAALSFTNGELDVGCDYGAGTRGSFWGGNLDEIRISNAARSANYVTTAFNSQSSPSTFYSMGSEQEPAPVESSFTADAVLKGAQASSFTADAVLEGTQADSFTADAWLAIIYTLTADAVLKEAQASSLTADAVLKETQSSSFTADGVLLQTTSGSFSADAVLKGTIAGSFTADACLTTAAVSAKQPLFTKTGPVHIPVFPFQPISVAVSANHTADYRGIIFCNATSGSLAVTLPDATGNLDTVYTITHTSGSHDVQVVGTGGDTINDETTQTISQYDAIKVISNNVEWRII